MSLPITVETATAVNAGIEAYVSGASGNLARAARHLAGKDDLDGAIALIDASIAVEETWFNTWLKADFLHQQEDNKPAYKLAKKAQELGNADGDGFFWKERVDKAVAEWKRR